mmetsp:Transcript_13153/g.19928  ORF Transcript_13153/g.19928 Transcript_13153/m.19928 type:complete len:261 (-) Transcript_13153:64-846(-)
MEIKGTPASPATAFANKVFPVPGGPSKITPRGIWHPFLVYASGCFKKSTTSSSSIFAPSQPATSSKFTPVSGIIWICALLLPNAIGPPPPPPPRLLLLRDRKNNPANMATGMNNDPRRSAIPDDSCSGRTVTSTLCSVSSVRSDGSFGRASILILVPALSTPSSCVPSGLKVTFSISSPSTNFKKSEYLILVGPPLAFLFTAGISDGGGTSAAMNSCPTVLFCRCWKRPRREYGANAAASSERLANARSVIVGAENFIVV